MTVSRVIKYDLKCGFAYNRIKFLLVALFILALTVYFYLITGNVSVEGISFGDLLIFFLKGETVYSPERGNLPISITYLGLQIAMACLIGYYPNDDIYGYGKQVFIRCGDKKKWFMGKVVWNIATVLVFYGTMFVLLFLFSLVFGLELSLDYHREVLQKTDNLTIFMIEPASILQTGVGMSVMYSITISLVQMVFALGTTAITVFLVIMIYDFAALFVANGFFLSNYTMILRNIETSSVRLNPLVGMISLLILLLFAIITGQYLINKKQLL